MKKVLVVLALVGLMGCVNLTEKKVAQVRSVYNSWRGWWYYSAVAEDGSTCDLGTGASSVQPGHVVQCNWKEREKTK